MLPAITRSLFQLAWPVFIGQLAVMATSVVDTVMAGQLGAVDLAAVGIGASIFASFFIALMAVLLALTPIVARLHGAGRHEAIGEQVRQSAWVAALLCLPCLALCLWPEPFLWLSQVQPEVETQVRAYLAYLAWSLPALLGFRVFYGLSTAVSLPRPVMLLNLLALGLKLPLNAWFMFGGLGVTAMGGPGAALATTVSQWLVLLCALVWLWREPAYRPYAVFARWSGPDWRVIRDQLKLGLPIGGTFLVDVTAYTFMALFIARLGAQVSAAHQIAANVGVLCFMLPASLGQAASVVVGQASGAGDSARARRAAQVALGLGLTAAVPVCLTLALGRQAIAGFYVADPLVAALAASLLLLVACYHLFDALQAVAVNVLRGYHRTFWPMFIYATALWGPGLGGGCILGLGWGLDARRGPFTLPLFGPLPLGAPGFWLAAILSLALAGLTVTLYLAHISRQIQPVARMANL